MKHEAQPLSLPQQLAYAAGNLGWATLLHVIYTLMVYFYLPPKAANIPQYITQARFFGVLNAIVLIAAAGRVLEAFTDPLIAGLSDRSHLKRGRRIPFMLIGFLPAAATCALMFMPLDDFSSTRNLVWLIAMQTVFYPAFSLYAIPHSALLIEVTHDEKQRLNLATFTSLAYALSSLTAAMAPVLAGAFQRGMSVDRSHGLQYAIVLLSAIAAVCMALPIIFVSEKKHSSSLRHRQKTNGAGEMHQPVWLSLKTTFQNPCFLQFVASDCVYWTGLNIVTTGMLYYITVLLGLKEEALMVLMMILLATSFAFYPLVNYLGRRISRKKLIQAAFVVFAAVFAFVFFLGRVPLAPYTQAVITMMVAALPFAFLGILPNTILANIAEHDMLTTGVRKEGMYFAARTMVMKVGQTFGIILFTILLSFGKERGNDIGVRMSGIAGFVLCLFAAVIFQKYDEEKTLREIERLKAEAA